MARRVFDLAAQQGLHLTLLDIGGGFPGWDGSESVYHPHSDTAAVRDGSAAMQEAEAVGSSGSGSGGDTATAPPLSLADVAKVTVPALDRLFPPSSGVRVSGRFRCLTGVAVWWRHSFNQTICMSWIMSQYPPT